MIKRILQTILLVIGIIVYIPSLLIEILAAVIINAAVGIPFKCTLDDTICSLRSIWNGLIIRGMKLIWQE